MVKYLNNNSSFAIRYFLMQMARHTPGFEYSFVGIGTRIELWNQQHFVKSGTQTRTMKKTHKHKFKFFQQVELFFLFKKKNYKKINGGEKVLK
jgi:hypothetical protein